MAGKSNKLKIKKLQINFTNRWLYTLIVFFSLIVIGVGVYAYTTDGSGVPNVMGHSADEIEGVFWNQDGSDIYYDDGNIRIYDSTPTLEFGDAFGNPMQAGVKLHVADKFLDVGDWYAGGGAVGIRFFTDDVERMKIHTDGVIGIYDTTTARLVFGRSSTSTPWAGVQLNVADKFLDVGDWWGGADHVGLRFFTDNVERMRINTDGSVDVGGTVTATAFVGDGSGLTGIGTGTGDNNFPEGIILGTNDETCSSDYTGMLRYTQDVCDTTGCHSYLEVCMRSIVNNLYEWRIIKETQSFSQLSVTYCDPENRPEVCTAMAIPVCGMPIYQGSSNACTACMNSDVFYHFLGTCDQITYS